MRVTKSFSFDSSHLLAKHPGKCSRLHGHTWELEVGIDGRPNPDSSFVLDYAVLTGLVKPVVDFLDHRHLNFLIGYPSSENICQFFGRYLQRLVDGHTVQRVIIRLKETQKTQATWDSASQIDIAAMMSNDGSAAFIPVIPDNAPDDGTLIIGGGCISVAEMRALRLDFRACIRGLVDGVNVARQLHQEQAIKNNWFTAGVAGAVQVGGGIDGKVIG